MKGKKPVVGWTDSTLYAEGKSMVQLRRYLCSAASSPGRPVNTDMCRKCESQCAFGRQWIRRIDAGKIPDQESVAKTRIHADVKVCAMDMRSGWDSRRPHQGFTVQHAS